MLHKYCDRLRRRLFGNSSIKEISNKTGTKNSLANSGRSTTEPYQRIVVHYTTMDHQKRVNAAFLIGAYSIIYLNRDPDDIYKVLTGNNQPDYIEFLDASCGMSDYTITLLDCFHAIKKSYSLGFFNFDDFDAEEYEYYEV